MSAVIAEMRMNDCMSNLIVVHLQRDFGDKRVFSERRRNDSYAEEEPEWFSGGPTSQSETIELIGFDDKILEEDKRRPKRPRKKSDSIKEGESSQLSLAKVMLVVRTCFDVYLQSYVSRAFICLSRGSFKWRLSFIFFPMQ